ncbi:hypothetical protein B9T13_02850 [Wohlfahrtiimonas chitiniclastica]|uniref:hypothetical protein n=1 Tax=Wohlfahrtiimonas chitiniclastica TaxID=400946 RepID=UPI000B98C3A3|nr:hypothetical protein [Wohlfahrtiimonas chitiniclastica]OYQ71625.1 hypothetical protein B9T13_02850 [Wohlfahrtiimonas chitiniclastica]
MREIRRGSIEDANFFDEQEPWHLRVECGDCAEYRVMWVDDNRAAIGAINLGGELLRLYTFEKYRDIGLGSELAEFILDEIIEDRGEAVVHYTPQSRNFWRNFADQYSDNYGYLDDECEIITFWDRDRPERSSTYVVTYVPEEEWGKYHKHLPEYKDQ